MEPTIESDARVTFTAEVRRHLEPHVPPEALDDLAAFCAALRDENERINLTGIRDARGMALRHVVDSLTASRLLELPFDDDGLVADVGSGCGVPGVPLAIVHEDRRFVLVESRLRKSEALARLVAAVGLADRVDVAHARGAAWLAEHPVDVVVTRAVGPVASQLEHFRPVRAQFRRLLMLKGPGVDEELEAAGPRLRRLGFSPPRRMQSVLPEGEGTRVVLEFDGARDAEVEEEDDD